MYQSAYNISKYKMYLSNYLKGLIYSYVFVNFFSEYPIFPFNLDEFSLLFFDHTETSQFTGGGMQILTYIWHSWQLFAACQTYYDTGILF